MENHMKLHTWGGGVFYFNATTEDGSNINDIYFPKQISGFNRESVVPEMISL